MLVGYQYPRTLVAADCLLNTTGAAIRLPKLRTSVAGLRGSETDMKITARLLIVIVLVLAFSSAEPAGLRAATVSADKNTAASGDKNSAPLDQQQMRGLDEQVQEIKSDVLSISQELSRLEEKLLYP